jgi:hypothetical protein
MAFMGMDYFITPYIDYILTISHPISKCKAGKGRKFKNLDVVLALPSIYSSAPKSAPLLF